MIYKELNINQKINIKGNDFILYPMLFKTYGIRYFIYLATRIYSIENRHLQLFTKNIIKIF